VLCYQLEYDRPGSYRNLRPTTRTLCKSKAAKIIMKNSEIPETIKSQSIVAKRIKMIQRATPKIVKGTPNQCLRISRPKNLIAFA
jgi:hypothetical protein